MHKSISLSFIALVFLAGCASQVAAPKTPEQSLYAAYGAYIYTADTTAELLQQGVIPVSTAKSVQEKLDAIATHLDSIRDTVIQGDGLPENELEWLKLAQKQLQSIQSNLESQNE